MHILRKTFGPLSPGTRVEILKQIGTTISVVRLVTPPSQKLREQRHQLIEEMGETGIFECPTEWLVQRRERDGRRNRKAAKAKAAGGAT